MTDLETPAEPLADLVILVHGTFAGDRNDEETGHRWWQRSSSTWEWLSEHLPDGVTLPGPDVRLFQWTGDNTQSARLDASMKLLAELVALEREGRGYHLVGHSHGGSIIWEALISARVLRKSRNHHFYRFDSKDRDQRIGIRPSRRSSNFEYLRRAREEEDRQASNLELQGLRSWTTVGTPFLHFLPRRRRPAISWRNPRFTLNPLRRTLDEGIWVLPEILLTCCVAFVMFADMSGHAHFGRLRYWLAALVAATIGGSIMTDVAGFTPAIVTREQAARATFEEFRERWLGLWAPDDEAIALLTNLTAPGEVDYQWLCLDPKAREARPAPDLSELEIPFKIRLNPPPSTDLAPLDSNYSLSRLFKLFYFAFNEWIGPRLGNAVTGVLRRSAQGSDLARLELAFAAPTPLPLPGPPMPGLPERTVERMNDRARRNAAEAAPAARQLLAQAALDTAPIMHKVKAAKLPGADGALLHTSYFEDPDVRELIRFHIARNYPGNPADQAEPELDEPLLQWLTANAEAHRSRFVAFRAAVPD